MNWEKDVVRLLDVFILLVTDFYMLKWYAKVVLKKKKSLDRFHRGLQWILAAAIVLTQVPLLTEDSVKYMIISSIVSVFHMQN